jgi:uncharacterized BrkB/YihY/UPF0761 family membrane protein
LQIWRSNSPASEPGSIRRTVLSFVLNNLLAFLLVFGTALLLVGLQQLVSNSIITIGSHFLSYGAIGSVMILLLWIYLTCQIFFIGCEFSYVYAHLFGSRRHRTTNPSDSPVLMIYKQAC